MERRPSAEEISRLEQLFPGSTPYCPICQRAAMEAHMERNTRWYALVCPDCDRQARRDGAAD